MKVFTLRGQKKRRCHLGEVRASETAFGEKLLIFPVLPKQTNAFFPNFLQMFVNVFPNRLCPRENFILRPIPHPPDHSGHHPDNCTDYHNLITILGNTLIIAAVATTRRLRTVTNYFVVSLAVSDLLVGLLVMPFAVVKEVTDGLWLFGQVACELWVSLDVMLCTASILNLCCISLDRYTSSILYFIYMY
ncbi:octopamine receptor 1 [Caerostris extrusa]|uniref:Octopamine receptor 1 n=1 Tax=Caerostris extrusa TaxID=172846 RepID=A0AAV4PCH2_CAEEX|nr:octopamine receptor 1 [Caerostris extrusa]